MGIIREKHHSLLPVIGQLGPISFYLSVFFIFPLTIFFVYSFWSVSRWDIIREWSLNNYVAVFTSPLFIGLFFRSIVIGLTTAALSVIAVYPLAYAMAFKFTKYRDLILFLLAISLFSNYLVRIYAWKSILSSNGLFNYIAMQIGLASEPAHYLIYSQWGVIIVLLNCYIPFAALPIYSSLLNIKRETIEAAADLGAGPFQIFRKITLPLSLSGVIVSFLFVFLLATGDFVTPQLVGGKTMMIGNAIATQFGIVSNWPLGAAMAFSAIGMIALLLTAGFLLYKLLFAAWRKWKAFSSPLPRTVQISNSRLPEGWERRRPVFPRLPFFQGYSALILIFMFLPILILVVLSFSRNTTGVFPLQGFTLDWYRMIFDSPVIWPALENSVIVAVGTAVLSAVLGTPAAFALAHRSFRLKNAFRVFLTLPISMPKLLIGIAMLSAFAFLSISRSLITVTIAHVLYCLPYMVLVVLSRLNKFDFSVKEAAYNLGASPFQTFTRIIFPLIRPTLFGAMLLIFSLSFDMFVITYFNIGAQSTLPMVIWSMLRLGINPSLNALCTIIITISVVLLFTANRFGVVKFGPDSAGSGSPRK